MAEAVEMLAWTIITPCFFAAVGMEWWRRSNAPLALKAFDALTIGLLLILAWAVFFVQFAPRLP